MDITPLVPKGKNLIDGYGKGYILVNGKKHYAPIIISPDQFILDVKNYHEFLKLDKKPEILIIGSDSKINRSTLDINVEFMSFGAACRTYNVLLTEGREVACFLCENFT